MADSGRWKLLDKKTVFSSKWLSIEDRTYELPDGTRTDGYFHLNRADYVLVVAVNASGQIVIEKQYRRGVDDFVFEIPAGYIDENESPSDAAVRELKEETGFIGTVEWVQKIYPQAGLSSMKAFIVLMNITDHIGHTQDHDENISYELMDFSAVKKMISEGAIQDMGCLSALEIYSCRKNL